jgi:hypothetical protein
MILPVSTKLFFIFAVPDWWLEGQSLKAAKTNRGSHLKAFHRPLKSVAFLPPKPTRCLIGARKQSWGGRGDRLGLYRA